MGPAQCPQRVLVHVDSCCSLATPRCYNGIANSKVILSTLKIGPPRLDKIKNLRDQVHAGRIERWPNAISRSPLPAASAVITIPFLITVYGGWGRLGNCVVFKRLGI